MGRYLLVFSLLLPAVGNAKTFRNDVFITERPAAHGGVLARQAIAATGKLRAESRTIYLNPYGVQLRPGDNDSRLDTSSIVTVPTIINGWDIDQDTWDTTVDCMKEIYAPFDVTITDEDPGDVPHIEAVFGGSPLDVGLPDTVAGVSPFTNDCAIIENSIVFTFTDVLPDDPRVMCEVMAQEVAHSFGLDHEMLPSDPMTYLTYAGERTFQDEMASCGEFGGRMCGINGSICRTRQNSYSLLMERLGPSQPTADEPQAPSDGTVSGVSGCNTAGGGLGWGLVILVVHVALRRRSRGRGHRSLLQ